MSTYITSERISYFISILKEKGKSDNTISSYSSNINKLVLFLDGSGLSKEYMAAYKKWLTEKGFKHRTINAYLATANYFCEVMGWQDMKIRLDSLDYYELQNPMQISVKNYNKIVYTALQNGKERLAMIIQLLCQTDLRFCELKFLTVDTLENGFVEVTRKHSKARIIIPDVILRDLNTYVNNEKIVSGIIFRTRNGSFINRSNFGKDLKKICVLAGINEDMVSIQRIKNVVIDTCPYYELNK